MTQPELFMTANPDAVQAFMLSQKAAEAELASIRDRGHRFASATPIDCRLPPEGPYFCVIHGHRKRASQIHTGLTSTHFPVTFAGEEYARGMVSEGLNFVPAKFWDGEWPANAKHLHDNTKWGVLFTLPPNAPVSEDMIVHEVWLETLAGVDTLASQILPVRALDGSQRAANFGSDPAAVARLLRLLAKALPDDTRRKTVYLRAAKACDQAIISDAEMQLPE